MKWLSNIYNPKEDDARYHVTRMIDETDQEAWERYLDWLKGKVIGQPKATSAFTVEELEEMKMVGVYLPNWIEEVKRAISQ
jgi:hypothetical protein